MPDSSTILAFAALSLGLVLTPGPNMAYLVSRAICQGRAAALVSLGGVALGFVVYMLCAALGLAALVLAIPYAYVALRLSGALYLGFLAWQALKPGGRTAFEVQTLKPDSAPRLFTMGLVTNLLNPKIALLYLALLPHFVAPERGWVLGQTLVLGSIQIAISVAVNAVIAIAAGSIAVFLARRPGWLRAQRWIMGGVLGGLAVRMAIDDRR